MDKVIILDANMASAFAKIKRLELLKRTFGKGELGVFWFAIKLSLKRKLYQRKIIF